MNHENNRGIRLSSIQKETLTVSKEKNKLMLGFTSHINQVVCMDNTLLLGKKKKKKKKKRAKNKHYINLLQSMSCSLNPLKSNF